jgi:hypothetical protein
MKYSKEFKEAISHLPDKEKDKLILRLLKKDIKLANRLVFELVSDQTIEERREEIEERIIKKADDTAKHFHSVGYLNMHVRYLSGEISEHVYNTKDKFGEVYLNLKMINQILSVNHDNIENLKNNSSSHKFFIAVIARAYKLLILISKLHEDHWIELEEELNRFGNLIGKNHKLMQTAIFNGLDVNWLLQFNIPEDIVEYHKDLRQQGYLK